MTLDPIAKMFKQFLLLLLIGFNSYYAANLIHLGCFNRVDSNITHVATINNLVDLWFKPNSMARRPIDDPKKCVEACYSASFRYGGVYRSSISQVDCLCGSSYGRNGPGICMNCTSQRELHCGSSNAFSIYDTNFKVPSPPQNITLLQRPSENSLRISWLPPMASNGPLHGFLITATPVFTHFTKPLQPIQWEIPSSPLHHYLVGLAPGTKYSVTISAVNSEGPSQPQTAYFSTKIGVPDPPPRPTIISEDKGRRTMSIRLTPGRNTKGPISSYRLILIDDSITPFFNKDHIYSWNDTNSIGYSYYLAAEFTPDYFPYKFTVGDGNRYGGYFNGPIPSGHWHPKLGVVSSLDGVVESSYSGTGHDQHSEDTSESRNKEYYGRVEIIDSDSTLVKILWISIGISAGILALCLAGFIILKMNLLPSLRRRISGPSNDPNRGKPPGENHQLTVRAHSISTPSFTVEEASGAYTHSCFIHEDDDVKATILEKLKQVWYIPRNFMDLPNDGTEEGSDVKLIGKGAYGPVYSSSIKSKNSLVSLHALPSGAFYSGRPCSLQPDTLEGLYTDLDNLIKLENHENVVKLIGFIEEKDQMLFAIEYGGLPLKSWLLEYRESLSGKTSTTLSLSPYSLLICAMNIAEGMYHLQTYKTTHGQLSASNILLENIEKPKVSGFGILSQNPLKEQRDYTRWTAQEKFQNRCIRPCDSWSFGVLLWEIASLGGTPYHDIKSEDLSRRIPRGARPSQVEVMGDGLYQVMLHTWQIDRDERPDFDRLSCSIHELLPHAAENLFISPSFNYPPYIHEYEYMS